ncbi:MAG: hypothetical protein U0807_06890 [Candidatus Binatia bacterium]
MTLIELVGAIAAVAIIMGIAVPHFSRDQLALWGAQSQVLGDLRRARTDSLTKGDHFLIRIVNDTDYAEYRMQLIGATWTVAGGPIRSWRLPGHVRFTTGVGSSFEFNTRGLMVLPSAALTMTLTDDLSGQTRNVTVWPSGQVAPL